MIQVSVIIPTYKDSQRLSQCLKALAEQSVEGNFFEVIVVNNAPEDVLPAFALKPRNLKILVEPAPGSYAARNAGLAQAAGKIIGFTDSDCVPDRDWIRNAVSHFEDHPGADRVSGPVKIFCKRDYPTAIELYDTIYAFPQKKYAQDGVGVTANLFVKSKVFETVGPFNSHTMSGGDLEWGSRATRAGFKLEYSERVIINHPARDSLRSLFDKAKRVGKGQVIFSDQKENLWGVLVEIARGLRPKTWEVRRIFREGTDVKFFKKIYLVFLRHLVLWNMDFWRISTKTKIMLAHKIRN